MSEPPRFEAVGSVAAPDFHGKHSAMAKIDPEILPLRLILSPEPLARVDPPTSAGKHVRFHASLEGVPVCLSDQPVADAARILMAKGMDPAILMTARMVDRTYDNFVPMPLGEWAKVAYTEGSTTALVRRRWQPHPDAVSRLPGQQKVEVEASAGVEGPPEKESLL
jgi:hypothetical protein